MLKRRTASAGFFSQSGTIKIGTIGEQEQPIKMKKMLGCRSYSVLQLGISTKQNAVHYVIT